MRGRFIAALLVVSVACAPAVLGQTDAERLKKTVDETVQIQKETQQKQDEWVKARAELTARYRTALANVNYLQERKAMDEKRLLALEESVAEMRRRLTESKRLSATIQDTLNTVLGKLEEWVDSDLPFLMEERAARLEYLKKELVRPDVSDAEKLRRLLEALQIEMNYGSTVEVVPQKIIVKEEELFVDLLRLGRVSVFWRTPDGARCGEFDRASKQWEEFPGKHSRTIGVAMEMASRMRPVELLSLPLGRIEP